MIDGRFDQHFLEIFAGSTDRSVTLRPLLFLVAVASFLALVSIIYSGWPQEGHAPVEKIGDQS